MLLMVQKSCQPVDVIDIPIGFLNGFYIPGGCLEFLPSTGNDTKTHLS